MKHTVKRPVPWHCLQRRDEQTKKLTKKALQEVELICKLKKSKKFQQSIKKTQNSLKTASISIWQFVKRSLLFLGREGERERTLKLVRFAALEELSVIFFWSLCLFYNWFGKFSGCILFDNCVT